ncbi:protease pro-enzyme activation domain-containing protein [Rhodanobacter sp. L36]|uniref:protease pro-enzyme activation domain-containing protein n=1 Tax=Rhodanobacter sp. L36 TaxID=1747221 RepID=UPI00131B3ADF|nr:protease pro-enzyme activation domain-containing protein [Rhodanobacter sp. L36]
MTTIFQKLPLTALAFSTALALAAASTTSAQVAVGGTGIGAAVANATTLRPGDAFTGVLTHTQPLHIVVALKLRNAAQLQTLISARGTMTSAAFSATHAPTALQAQAVANYLTRSGFTHVTIASNNMLVSADGTASNAQAAFATTLSRVQTLEGRSAFANNSDVHVPAALQDSVLSVIGLQNVYQLHTFAQRAQPMASGTISITSHNPVEFSAIYGGTGVQTGAGVTVGIIAQGDITQSIVDLNTFTAANGLATVPTQVVNTGPASSDTSGDIEWDIDGQDIVGAAGGQVGKIIYYVAPTLSDVDILADINGAMSANAAKVINVSLGGCETGAKGDGTAAAADQIFQAAIAQGQTFAVATGDFGADECRNGTLTPNWPASSPYVLAVGGTTLSASTTTWGGETVWINGGGSPSTYQLKPVWQNALVPGTKRGTPDIAMEGDPASGANVTVNGGFQLWGGTSLATPIFVGLWSRIIAIKGPTIGFAPPLLYQLPSSDFHDVTVGTNGGEAAKVGYDFATGRGSVILSKLLAHVGAPSPLTPNFSLTATSLIAKFTDHSTDTAGTIVTHAWTFGDNGTSTAASPSHLYPKAGVYTVSETVTDNVGYVLAKTTAVTIGK